VIAMYDHTDQWFDFQRVVFYYCSTVTIALKCTVFKLEAWDRHTDGQTDGNSIASHDAPT